MNAIQRERKDSFLNTNFFKPKAYKVSEAKEDNKPSKQVPHFKELLQQIVGDRRKISDDVVKAIGTAVKFYCGQLTEEARVVQIEEMARSYGGQHNLPAVLKLGAVEPHHLQEARRRVIK